MTSKALKSWAIGGRYLRRRTFNPLVESSNLARPTSNRKATFGWLFLL